ncbi:MAG: cysteine peptidase family C39 domain-containing protein [Acidobacteriota bacterium]
MAAGPGRPRVRKSTASLILAGCLLAGCLTVSIGLFVLRDPVAASRQFYRWRLGGELLSASDVVLQEYRNDCGPAALKMILEHYGVTISLEECRREVGLKSGGTSMLRLLEVAEHHGIRARGMRYDVSRLADIPTPLIAYLRIGHFVVVQAIDSKAREVVIKDPAVGRLRLSVARFAALWGGESLVFQPLSETPGERAIREGPDSNGTIGTTRLHASRAGRSSQ